nr:hypothetical protein Iba_scaffold13991CG0010 [Ipomoea batatas]
MKAGYGNSEHQRYINTGTYSSLRLSMLPSDGEISPPRRLSSKCLVSNLFKEDKSGISPDKLLFPSQMPLNADKLAMLGEIVPDSPILVKFLAITRIRDPPEHTTPVHGY